jgi:pre-mRNA-splicing helicase BRR2
MQSELKAQQTGKKAVKPIRIVSLSCPIANGRDVAMWLGVDVDSGAYFNFSPAVRPQPIEATVQSFDQFNRPARLLAMAKPAYN